jgi:hypothetical protein
MPSEEATAATEEPPSPDNSSTLPAGDELESTAVSTSEEVPPDQSPNSRLAAWTLGSRLSLAALANDRGVAAKSIPKWLEASRAAAEALGTSVTDLPERPAATDSGPASKQVLNYLFDEGQRIGRELQTAHGADHAALVEVAVKSGLLLLLYEPGSTTVDSIVEALEQAAPRAGLPPELLQPLVKLIEQKSTPEDVRAGVRRMHAEVDRFLAGPVEP